MKQGLVGSLLASQEAMDRRKNSFELYGADFMVMDDFSVWLIEINSHPDMSYSSKVTTRLCKQVLEDTIKGIIEEFNLSLSRLDLLALLLFLMNFYSGDRLSRRQECEYGRI